MRLTKARKQILKEFGNIVSPISAFDLLKKVKVNKTTIYRELNFLLGKNLIQEVDLLDGKKRYEGTDSGHHHHLVCISCNDVKDVDFEENFDLPGDFSVIKHSLEFFGYCKNCQ